MKRLLALLAILATAIVAWASPAWAYADYTITPNNTQHVDLTCQQFNGTGGYYALVCIDRYARATNTGGGSNEGLQDVEESVTDEISCHSSVGMIPCYGVTTQAAMANYTSGWNEPSPWTCGSYGGSACAHDAINYTEAFDETVTGTPGGTCFAAYNGNLGLLDQPNYGKIYGSSDTSIYLNNGSNQVAVTTSFNDTIYTFCTEIGV